MFLGLQTHPPIFCLHRAFSLSLPSVHICWCVCVAAVQSVSCADSLWPHGLPHARLLCPPLSPGVHSNSCLLSQWCYLTMSSSAASFSCPQSFPASGSFSMSWLFTLGGQNIEASASVLPMNIQDWFPLGLTGWISLLSKGLSRVFSAQFKTISSSALSLLYGPTLTPIHKVKSVKVKVT